MPKVKPDYGKKWARVTPQRTEDYVQGISNPRADWAQETAKAESNWADGVQKAVQDKRFAKGVQKAGSEKWARKSLEVGAPRFGPGVQAAEQDYVAGFAPFVTVIENTKLPQRFAKGDPRNIDRVKVMAKALRDAKLAGK